MTLAQPSRDSETVSVTISHADLNLWNEEGARALLERIEVAAAHVCGFERQERRMVPRREARRCMRKAIGGAVAQLKAPMVTALHRTGRPALLVAR